VSDGCGSGFRTQGQEKRDIIFTFIIKLFFFFNFSFQIVFLLGSGSCEIRIQTTVNPGPQLSRIQKAALLGWRTWLDLPFMRASVCARKLQSSSV
jgi:hypothetical protein